MQTLDLEHYFELDTAVAYPVLFRNRVTWPVGPCVYMLWHGRRLVYVGATVTHLPRRLWDHHTGHQRTPRKVFDRVTWIENDDHEALETALVERFRPVHNATPDGKGSRPRKLRSV